MKKDLNFIFVILGLLASITAGQTAPSSGKASAQKSPGNSKASSTAANKLVAIKVTGTERYTEQVILPASGLQLGQNVSEGDFKEAARRLGDTGLFSDVVYSFSYSGAGTKLELQLTDIEKSKLIPADLRELRLVYKRRTAERTSAASAFVSQGWCRLRAPFRPDFRALQAILTEKQLPGHVDYLRQGKQEGGDLRNCVPGHRR